MLSPVTEQMGPDLDAAVGYACFNLLANPGPPQTGGAAPSCRGTGVWTFFVCWIFIQDVVVLVNQEQTLFSPE